MHEPFPPAQPQGAPGDGPARWRHDLSNEVNAMTMATAAARHMLRVGDVGSAMRNLERAEDAAMRCAQLLRLMPPMR